MVRRLAVGMTVLAAIALGCVRTVEASPIMTLRPSTAQSAAPGDTIGWGYDIVNDSDDTLFFIGISADMAIADGTIDLSVFDFFNFQFFVAPHQEFHVDYAAGVAGLVEMTLSTLLSPGQMVTGRVFVDYLLESSTGLTPGTFELRVNATVPDTTPVPEPSTLLLLGTGAALLGRRRLRLARA